MPSSPDDLFRTVSASPIVKEIGELCFALYTPEGDSVALSTGIIVHVHTMSDAIKFMVRNGWEDNPEGWPEAPQAGSPVGGHGAPICWYWRSDADGVGAGTSAWLPFARMGVTWASYSCGTDVSSSWYSSA